METGVLGTNPLEQLQKNKSSGLLSYSLTPTLIAGTILLGLTMAVAWLAQSFPYEREPDRPIVQVVWVSWLASAVALIALLVGLRTASITKLETSNQNPQGVSPKRFFGVIVLFAIAFRLILVFSNPILEVDYYRYLWDGVAANQGVSPYRFSPDTVLRGQSSDPQLQTLQQLIADKPTLKTIVSRVHFEKYTTLYPPVSQLVFRITTKLTPDQASVKTHIIAIKLALILFDLGVVFCLGWMIWMLDRHPAWLMTYAWNPLVLKEIANGGHLDSIAIFFMTAGIGVFLWGIQRVNEDASQDARTQPASFRPWWWSPASGSLMSLGIGAKLFPVILMPALLFFLVAKKRWNNALCFAASCAVVTTIVLWPMFVTPNQFSDPAITEVNQTEIIQQPSSDDQSNDGLTVFVTQWRMNDALFSFIYQNVEYDWSEHGPAWYVFVPNETRIKWNEDLANLELANGNPAYFVARLVTVGLFGLFYLWVLVKLCRTDSALDLASWLFLIMGVFFFLQPTQNPWYWLWAMPLVCFAKNRGWLFVSLILFVYYLRFWYAEHEPRYEFWGSTYVGYDFYDHCIVWIEFATILSILIASRFLLPLGPSQNHTNPNATEAGLESS